MSENDSLDCNARQNIVGQGFPDFFWLRTSFGFEK